MKFIIAITCLLVIYNCLCHHYVNGNNLRSSAENEILAQQYLTQAGLRFPSNGKDEDKWITLCAVKARVANTGISEKKDIQRCTTTTGGEILEIRVVDTEHNFRCGWRTETYAANTLLNYKQLITNQYKSAISAAITAKESNIVINLLQEKQNQHVFNLEVASNKAAAMLEATATGMSWWGGGGNCAVKLEGRVKHLVY
ncbi:unnamed protein product [Adineta steineri]|uniref:Uncharacterized protein n=1 Tax=Adineta steineri TaxID=433720 RepID=A0A819N4B6_9BILA|nr:unnamed protein product [Adineta steineri]CAF1271737.1 unnamed protein product [Adineta steineri]CAF1287755.1 unnamed protein product [Adineta steineri]CAF3663827.1 unnamed protein product [Adineta steineri]CAF3988700.1 unnamed protein product [Adineta steineri]